MITMVYINIISIFLLVIYLLVIYLLSFLYLIIRVFLDLNQKHRVKFYNPNEINGSDINE